MKDNQVHGSPNAAVGFPFREGSARLALNAYQNRRAGITADAVSSNWVNLAIAGSMEADELDNRYLILALMSD